MRVEKNKAFAYRNYRHITQRCTLQRLFLSSSMFFKSLMINPISINAILTMTSFNSNLSLSFKTNMEDGSAWFENFAFEDFFSSLILATGWQFGTKGSVSLSPERTKRFYYRRPRESYYTMKTKQEPVSRFDISWYTWTKNFVYCLFSRLCNSF